ncbi:MAG TPA: hypothetical protein DCP69_07915 [Candidatus Omnitrophica bacterium]|nr:hypothetical protein [Candidatus Omnitrophota bacterium]
MSGAGVKVGDRFANKGQISPRQIKIIHTLVSALGMDRESYVALLQQVANSSKVKSSKELTWRQAENVIDDLQIKKGSPAPAKAKRPLPFTDLDGRPGMASGAQCRLMAASWSEVSRAETSEAKMKALDKFVKRIVGCDSIRFVKGWQVEKVMKAITVMKTKGVSDAETTTDEVGLLVPQGP